MIPRLAIEPALVVLRRSLQRAGYDQESLRRLLNISYPDDIGALNRTPTILRLQDDRSPLAVAARLFFLESDETTAAARKLFTLTEIATLVTARLLQQRSGRLGARLRVDPIGTQLFLADRRFLKFDRTAVPRGGADPVYPPSADSILLRDAVRVVPGGSLLDLCTGSGVQAISQSETASTLTVVDINPRAVALTKLNATFNEINPVEAHLGDLYHPVQDRQFDTIIANPPFVSSPYKAGPSYHAGGPTGDELLRRIIAGWGKHLRSHGRAFAVTHVGIRRGRDLAAVAKGWFRTFPGRAAVFEIESGSAIDLAAAQSMFALEHGLPAYTREIQRWVDYLKRHRIERIAALLIAAEKTDRAAVEVIDAHPRVLPLPLTAPPAQRVAEWIARP